MTREQWLEPRPGECPYDAYTDPEDWTSTVICDPDGTETEEFSSRPHRQVFTGLRTRVQQGA